MVFIHYNVKKGSFRTSPVPGFEKCKYPGCSVIQVVPTASRRNVEILFNLFFGGRGKVRHVPTVKYDPKKFKTPEEAFKWVLKNKKHFEKLKRMIDFQLCVETDGKSAEKELAKFLAENSIVGIRKATGDFWRVIITPKGLVLAYPRSYKRGYAIGRILYDEDVRKDILKLVGKAKKDLEEVMKKKITVYGDGRMYYRGRYFKVCYKKSTRPGVKIDEKNGVVWIRGKTVTEAKKGLERHLHRGILDEARRIIGKLSQIYGVAGKVVVTDDLPRVATSQGARFRPLGETYYLRGRDMLELHFSPELYLLEDWKRAHVIAHEFAHALKILRGMSLPGLDEHDSYFYNTLKDILQKAMPNVYRKETKVLGGKWIRTPLEENELLDHNKMVDDNIRHLKPLRKC